MICRLTWQRLDIQEILQLKFWNAANTRKIKLNCSCTCQTTAFSREFINYTCHIFYDTNTGREIGIQFDGLAVIYVGVTLSHSPHTFCRRMNKTAYAVHLRIISVTDSSAAAAPPIKIPQTFRAQQKIPQLWK